MVGHRRALMTCRYAHLRRTYRGFPWQTACLGRNICSARTDWLMMLSILSSMDNSLSSLDDRPHIQFSYSNDRLKLGCTVYYATAFDSLRRRCAIDKSIIASLTRTNSWNAQGGKSKAQGKHAGAAGSSSSLARPESQVAPPRVRMSAGIGVSVRGRSVLVKAPVFST